VERRWKVLIVAAVAVFMGFLDVTIVNVAFPDIERDFAGTSQADLSWVLNAYNIVFAALLVPAGRLADVLGRRRMFFVGVWWFLAASVLCGIAPSPGWLVGARVLQAVGGAILVPTSLSLLLPEFPAERRATAVSIWSATGAVAAAVGPSLGGLLVDGLDCSCARPVTARRSSTSACSVRARSRSRTRACSASRSPSTRCCSPTCCS
jgi:MFS family permease